MMTHDDDIEEPDDEDLVTSDHRHFYEHGGPGRLVLEMPAELSTAQMWKRLDDHMNRTKFYPNVWFISDHGNAHLMIRPKRPNYRKLKRERERDAAANKIIAAAERKYGGFMKGSLIAGGFYSHWPESVKNRIRKLRYGK